MLLHWPSNPFLVSGHPRQVSNGVHTHLQAGVQNNRSPTSDTSTSDGRSHDPCSDAQIPWMVGQTTPAQILRYFGW